MHPHSFIAGVVLRLYSWVGPYPCHTFFLTKKYQKVKTVAPAAKMSIPPLKRNKPESSFVTFSSISFLTAAGLVISLRCMAQGRRKPYLRDVFSY